MAQRLSFMLSREQVRLVHEAAERRLAAETNVELKKRWETIVRTMAIALAFKANKHGKRGIAANAVTTAFDPCKLSKE